MSEVEKKEAANSKACPLCGSHSSVDIISLQPKDIFRGLENILHVTFPGRMVEEYSGKPFILHECNECGLQFFHGLPGGSEEFYKICADSPNYYSGKWEFDSVLKNKSLVPMGSEILDIGCGSGVFLKMAEKAGLKVTGLEFNAKLAAEGRKNNADIFAMSAKEYRDKTGRQFDIVTCFHVLEHVREPLSFTKEILDLLRPGGIVFIAVPFRNSFACRILENAPMDCPPHHITHWDLPQLELLGKKTGLRKCYEEYDYNFAGYQIRDLLLARILPGGPSPFRHFLDRGMAAVVNRHTQKFWNRFHHLLRFPVCHSVLFGFEKP